VACGTVFGKISPHQRKIFDIFIGIAGRNHNMLGRPDQFGRSYQRETICRSMFIGENKTLVVMNTLYNFFQVADNMVAFYDFLHTNRNKTIDEPII
jgi:hypothetical protein